MDRVKETTTAANPEPTRPPEIAAVLGEAKIQPAESGQTPEKSEPVKKNGLEKKLKAGLNKILEVGDLTKPNIPSAPREPRIIKPSKGPVRPLTSEEVDALQAQFGSNQASGESPAENIVDQVVNDTEKQLERNQEVYEEIHGLARQINQAGLDKHPDLEHAWQRLVADKLSRLSTMYLKTGSVVAGEEFTDLARQIKLELLELQSKLAERPSPVQEILRQFPEPELWPIAQKPDAENQPLKTAGPELNEEDILAGLEGAWNRERLGSVALAKKETPENLAKIVTQEHKIINQLADARNIWQSEYAKRKPGQDKRIAQSMLKLFEVDLFDRENLTFNDLAGEYDQSMNVPYRELAARFAELAIARDQNNQDLSSEAVSAILADLKNLEQSGADFKTKLEGEKVAEQLDELKSIRDGFLGQLVRTQELVDEYDKLTKPVPAPETKPEQFGDRAWFEQIVAQTFNRLNNQADILTERLAAAPAESLTRRMLESFEDLLDSLDDLKQDGDVLEAAVKANDLAGVRLFGQEFGQKAIFAQRLAETLDKLIPAN